MDAKTVLIIGSRGQLGSDMVKICRSAGFNVIEIDYPDIDITDKAKTISFIEQCQAAYIINCAAYTAVDDCESHPKEAYALNAEGPRNIALGAQKTGATIIHISTDYVFDGEKSTPYLEGDLCNPLTVYGKTKLEGERLTAESCKKHQIYRIAWLYGTHGNNFVKTIRNVATKKKLAGESLSVVNDQFGTPTYTIEVCEQIVKMLGTDNYGIFHCTCEGSCSWYDFTKEVLSSSGIDIEVRPCTTAEFIRPAPRPHFSVLENSRLKKMGHNIMNDWKTAFQKFLAEEQTQ
jgi:dTDP-4-dehydrorhamnose reductase